MNMHKLHPDPKELGKLSRMDDASGRYVDFLKSTFPQEMNPEGMKVVLDCANGALSSGSSRFWGTWC